jgi:hypothetical protein
MQRHAVLLPAAKPNSVAFQHPVVRQARGGDGSAGLAQAIEEQQRAAGIANGFRSRQKLLRLLQGRTEDRTTILRVTSPGLSPVGRCGGVLMN